MLDTGYEQVLLARVDDWVAYAGGSMTADEFRDTVNAERWVRPSD